MNIVEETYIENDNSKDTSYQDEENFLTLMFGWMMKYDKSEMREAWLNGKKCGFEMGLYYNSNEGQMLQLSNNITNPKDKEFYDKFIALCNEYNIRITYHPQKGMTFEKLK